MVITEKEALNKYCCGGCAAHPQHIGKCLASECMAWRWVSKINDPEVRYEGSKEVRWGYCGLAGKS